MGERGAGVWGAAGKCAKVTYIHHVDKDPASNDRDQNLIEDQMRHCRRKHAVGRIHFKQPMQLANIQSEQDQGGGHWI